MQRFNFWIEKKMMKELEELGEELSMYQEKVTTSQLVRQAIRDLLEKMKKWPPSCD